MKQCAGRAGWNVTFFHERSQDYRPCRVSLSTLFFKDTILIVTSSQHSTQSALPAVHRVGSLWTWKGPKGAAHDSILLGQAASFLQLLGGTLDCRLIPASRSCSVALFCLPTQCLWKLSIVSQSRTMERLPINRWVVFQEKCEELIGAEWRLPLRKGHALQPAPASSPRFFLLYYLGPRCRQLWPLPYPHCHVLPSPRCWWNERTEQPETVILV